MKNTVVGNLEIVKLHHDGFTVDQERTIRIWTSTAYSYDKPLRVIYMFDGQNLFDDFTSFVGEWHIDETIEEGVAAGGEDFIVVGLDSSSERTNEYLPPEIVGEPSVLGGETMKFLIATVIPYVESHYSVKKGPDNRIVGGSSLGGLMAAYAYSDYHESFDAFLIFSPPLFEVKLKEEEKRDPLIKSYIPRLKNIVPSAKKVFLSCGGKGFEAEFVEGTMQLRDFLRSQGYGDRNLMFQCDQNLEHNEKQWTLFFKDAYRFITDKN